MHHACCTQKWFYFFPRETAAMFLDAGILLDVYLLDSVPFGIVLIERLELDVIGVFWAHFEECE